MARNSDLLNRDEIGNLAASLRPIEQKMLKHTHKQGVSRIWFQGEEPYFDMFFELKNDQIIWFQFTLRGKSLSWDSRTPIMQTGDTNELQIGDVSFYAASKTIEHDPEIDLKFVNLVKSILQARADETIFARALALFNENC
jgi:hypothetical protein